MYQSNESSEIERSGEAKHAVQLTSVGGREEASCCISTKACTVYRLYTRSDPNHFSADLRPGMRCNE